LQYHYIYQSRRKLFQFGILNTSSNQEEKKIEKRSLLQLVKKKRRVMPEPIDSMDFDVNKLLVHA
jgi:hypothetical protein